MIVQKTIALLRKFKESNVIYIRRDIRRAGTFFHHDNPNFPSVNKLSIEGNQTFFGYYDKTPFSLDNTKILGMIAPCGNHPPRTFDTIQIGYFDNDDKKMFHLLGVTETWCWQQGCRLQWYPDDENTLIIYNTLVNGKYGSAIQDVTTKEILNQYQCPVYDIDTKGKWAISLNFSRLHRLRPGYGYGNLKDETHHDPCPKKDGIWRMDLSSGNIELILSLRNIASINPQESMNGATHYINHLSFNPSGTRFMFFHLWLNKGKRFSRLFSCDYTGDHLYLLENEGIVSHYSWKSDDELLVFTYRKHSGSHYYLYKDKTQKKGILGLNVLKEDGHPSFSRDRKWLLTDTYPDRYSDRKLILFNPEKGIINLGSFFSPPNYREDVRCDLHPRWDREQNWVCFDSAHEGFRSMYLIDISTIRETYP